MASCQVFQCGPVQHAWSSSNGQVICSKILLCWMSARLNHRSCFQPAGDRGRHEELADGTKTFQQNDFWGIAGSAKPRRPSISVSFCLQINCTWVTNVLFSTWDSMWRCMRIVSWNSQNRWLGSGFACNVMIKSAEWRCDGVCIMYSSIFWNIIKILI